MQTCDGEGCGLLVGVVKFVEVFVQPGPVKYAMSPVRNVVLDCNKIYQLRLSSY